ncbi:MAG: NF041680 family putative transposase [Blastocatellia bacterium]
MKNKNTTQSQLSKLAAFRQSVYGCLTRARDALFELIDAVLTSPGIASFPELSCAPCFRRQWPSVYEALQDGKLNSPDLLKLEIKHLPPCGRPLLVGDHTAWRRVQARTLKDRSFVHQPTPIKGQKPISIGYRFSTLGVVPEASGSWFLPLLHERIESEATPSAKLAGQLKQVCPLLAEQMPERPLGLFDSEFGSAEFLNQTAGIDCDLLFRVKPNRKLRRAPGAYQGRGRRPVHGAVFRLSDTKTWHRPDEQWECEDEKLGPVKIKRWDNLHFEDAPQRPITLLRVERPSARGSRRDPRVVWLGYCGQQKLPAQDATWRQYLSRYVIEHWYRFIKQSLNWTLPQLSTPEQSQLWSSLLLIASWQLWLARTVAQDNPRPWQKPQPPEKMTPGRVQLGMNGVLAGIGTPAEAPKARGKSPGWPVGRIRTKRTRYAVIKKQSQQATQAKKDALTSGSRAA